MVAVGAADVTAKEIEPTGTVPDPPSGFGIVAVNVALPLVRPFTATLVLVVNVPVGLTMAAGLVILREIGVVLFEGVTVAAKVAV